MKVLRFFWNLILALLLSLVIVLVLTTALGLIVARTWENTGLDDGNPTSAWLWLDGEPIYYQIQGEESAPCVVLVHGDYVEGSQTWTGLAESLARAGRRVITLDLRGYGHSARATGQVYSVRQQAELLATALNNLQVQGATVVAHDLGGAVALQMALDQPQFVQRLVLVAPRLERTRQDNWGDRVWAWVLKVPYVRRAALWLRCAGGPGQTLERKLLYADPALVNAETMRGVRAATHIEGTLDALEAMAATPPDSDLPGALARLQAPVLILLGEEDRAVSVDDLAWTTALPSVETVSVPDAGHFVHQEQGALVSGAIIDASALQTSE